MFDNTDWTFFFFKLALSGVKAVHSIFLSYCVANTIAPARTRQAVTNLAWFGVEMYTIASISIGSFVCRKTEALRKYLPSSMNTNDQPCQEDNDVKCEHSAIEEVTFDDEPVNMKLIVLRKGRQLHVYYDLLQNSNTRSEELYGISQNEDALFKKVPYKFLSCAVFQHSKKIMGIELGDENGFGNFYTEGNTLLDRAFLKFYARRCVPKEAEKLVVKLEQDYEIQLIDGNADFVVLEPNQYIVLESDGIKCLTRNPPTVISSTEDDNEGELKNKEKTI
jgi:hypothetical protein